MISDRPVVVKHDAGSERSGCPEQLSSLLTSSLGLLFANMLRSRQVCMRVTHDENLVQHS